MDEVAVKRSLGKLDAPDKYLSLLLGGGAQALAVTIEHAVAVESLPWHHRDPFDRMLVAQAAVEGGGDRVARPGAAPLRRPARLVAA